MIKGSTKLGEVFLCGPETEGIILVLPQFLGKSISGFGRGGKKMYVIGEDDTVVTIQPRKTSDMLTTPFRGGEITPSSVRDRT